ncbi:MAG TPA: ABC transporter substrate-binding protein [Bdellovibrionota bacterium]|nr:ABC transporter substrate-binding protein [Bdellovibrionota bacterium]
MILKNQFEPLVGRAMSGTPTAGVARSWEIDPGYRTFTFHLDENRRFSDGSPVTAADFKAAWERSLSLIPRVDNSSLLDMAYAIDGFDQFHRTGHLAGVMVDGPSRLVVRFKRPFRMALHFLSGSRSAVYKKTGESFIGSGPYIIQEIGQDRLRLMPNPHHPSAKELSAIEVYHGETEEILHSLELGKTDVASSLMGTVIPADLSKARNVELLPGPYSAHRVGYVNGHRNSCLVDASNRRALQFAIWRYLRKHSSSSGDSGEFLLDPQVYLEGQPGRISREEAFKMIDSAESQTAHLIRCTANQPLKIWVAKDLVPVAESLADFGIGLARVGVLDIGNYFEVLTDPSQWDLVFGSFSIPHADPDGIYHALGKNGAILTRVTYREEVGSLLESGRSLLKFDEMDRHYRKVTEAILTAVPMIHLGFTRSFAVVRSDRVEVRNVAFQRGEAQFDAFRLR